MLQKRKQKRVQKAAHGTRVSRECVTLVCDKYEIHGVKTSPATLYTGYYGMSTRYRCGHYGMFLYYSGYYSPLRVMGGNGAVTKLLLFGGKGTYHGSDARHCIVVVAAEVESKHILHVRCGRIHCDPPYVVSLGHTCSREVLLPEEHSQNLVERAMLVETWRAAQGQGLDHLAVECHLHHLEQVLR